jgi:hypothetical protein
VPVPIGSTLTDAIQIGTGTQAITTALNIASTGVTTDISLQNAETISNDTDGTIAMNPTIFTLTGTTTLTATSLTTVSLGAGAAIASGVIDRLFADVGRRPKKNRSRSGVVLAPVTRSRMR